MNRKMFPMQFPKFVSCQVYVYKQKLYSNLVAYRTLRGIVIYLISAISIRTEFTRV